ncbi:hypothetical protein [Argonema galeatum]|uniref:hypothetical protein n=1 Tax=Argonema galeatum TaxID=2942762 RepID=UPI002012CC70|nr:hypothetical protein [Argonema galeatum]MCL1468432.1 hypothetical protein [Argonema galeatum A003/A1]
MSNFPIVTIQEKLLRLRDFRNQADYNDTCPKLVAKTEEALGLAMRIISGISNLETATI